MASSSMGATPCVEDFFLRFSSSLFTQSQNTINCIRKVTQLSTPLHSTPPIGRAIIKPQRWGHFILGPLRIPKCVCHYWVGVCVMCYWVAFVLYLVMCPAYTSFVSLRWVTRLPGRPDCASTPIERAGSRPAAQHTAHVTGTSVSTGSTDSN